MVSCPKCGKEITLLAKGDEAYCPTDGYVKIDSVAGQSTQDQLRVTKFCLHCGKELPGLVDYCPSCGKEQKPQKTEVIMETEQAKESHNWYYLLPIFLSLLGGIIGYWALRKMDKRMARNVLIAGIILFIIYLIILNGASTLSTVQHVTQPAKQVSPVQYSFSGTGMKSTQNFYIPIREWAIWYNVKATSIDPSYSSITIFVYPEGETARYIATASYHGAGQDYTIVHHGPGNYYIMIIAANCEYDITVKAPP